MVAINNTPADTPAADGSKGDTKLSPSADPKLQDLKPHIEAAAAETGYSADEIAAVIWKESRADPNVAGGGLMQIGQAEFDAQKAKHPNLIKGDITDPASNIMAGALYMKELQGNDSLGFGLRRYNSGPFGIDENNLNAIPAGTGDPKYVTLVTDYTRKLDAGQPLPP